MILPPKLAPVLALSSLLLAGVSVAEPSGKQGPGAFAALREEYRRSGSWSALEHAVASGGERKGLDLAAEALRAESGEPMLIAAIVNAMNAYQSTRALEILREAIHARRSLETSGARQDLSRAWAAMFFRMQKGDKIDAALAQAQDETKPAELRALALQSLAMLGRGKRPERERALAAYRPFLNDPDPELRLAAVHVNGALWDYERIETLKELAFGDDPTTRWQAYYQVTRYLEIGPEFGPNESTLSLTWRARNPAPFDPAGLVEWRSRKREWTEEQGRLVKSSEPPSDGSVALPRADRPLRAIALPDPRDLPRSPE